MGVRGGVQGLKAQEMDPKYLKELKKTYHLDRPLWERYLRTFIWYSPKDMKQPFTERFFNRDNWDGFLMFKFGNSFYRNKSVLELIVEKLPVSASLGIISFFMTYIICITLGIAKAVRSGSQFDTASSVLVLIGYSTPAFVLGLLLIVFFWAG